MHAIAYRTYNPTPRAFAHPFLVDSLFRDFFPSAYAADAPTVRRARLNVAEQGNAYIVSAELPGVAKEDIKVEIEGDEISIRAEAKTVQADDAKAAQNHAVAQSFARRFSLPEEVDADAAAAKYENGVLTLTLPKKATATARQVAVQ
jgi:HSP20 family protein